MKELFKIAIKGTKKYIIGILICSLISSFFMIQLTKFISYVIDGVIMQKSKLPQYITNSFYSENIRDKLIILAIYMLIFVGIISILNYMKSKFNTKFRLSMNKNLKTKLLEHMTYLEYGDYIKYGKHQILQRGSNDANYFVDFVTSKYNLIVESIFILIFSIYEILNINVIVSSVICVIIIVICIISIIYLKITKPIVKKNIDLHENIISRTMNAVYNSKMIKIFNREQKEIDEFNSISEEYRKNDIKLEDYLIYYELIGKGIRKFKDPVIFIIGGLLIINGKMNIGELMVLMTYSSNLLEYVVQLIYMVNNINHFLVPTDRISEFLKMKEENIEEKQYKLKNISLEFKEVTISINSIKILDNISFKIEKGKTIYLVGNNGSGKSILVKTLLGFIPYQGQILLGGIDIKRLNKSTIRNYIGVVFQESFIFSDTIKNNIDVLEKYKDLEEIKNITKICEIDNEILQFPNKYNEILSERGINLSGGQKQRISIARTLLQNKSIIIFDDVLSKIDNITKDKIKNNLKQYNKDMISIYITQDLSKIPNEETVFFIDNRKIIIDKQENLINKNENYYRLIEICKDIVGEINE